MADTKVRLVDWLDDLCVRFIINLPQEELDSPERICFQIEEAQWFYEDFCRPLDPTLPSLNLRKFCDVIFQHCPLLSQFSQLSAASYSEFMDYKARVPVRGAIMLSDDMTEVVLVKGWKSSAKWSFPRGKINKDEKDLDCAIREVYEETGYDIKAAGLVPDKEVTALDQTIREQHMRLFVFRGIPRDTYFEPRTRMEISKISWYKLAELPTMKREKQTNNPNVNGEVGLKHSHFYMVAPFIRPLKAWIKQQKKLDKMQGKFVPMKHTVLEEDDEADDLHVLEEPTEDEAHMDMTDAEDIGHMERLLFNLRTSRTERSDAVNAPEVSNPLEQSIDLSAQLKMMLSVGGPAQVPRHEGISMQPRPQQLQQPIYGRAPQTPAEQMDSTPPQAVTPHHQHPRQPPQATSMPPPSFPYPPGFGQPDHRFHPNGPRPFPHPNLAPNGSFFDGPNSLLQQQQFGHARANVINQGQQGFQRQLPMQQQQSMPPFPPGQLGASSMQQRATPQTQQQMPQSMQQRGPPQIPHPAPPVQQHAPKPWERSTPYGQQFPQYNQSSVVPAASKLPPPTLTAHARNLLNVFKSPTPSVAAPDAFHAQVPQSMPAKGYGAIPNLPVPVQAPSAHQIQRQAKQSPAAVQPQGQATKPKSTQQDTLLNIFRGPNVPSLSQPKQEPREPVELSAQSSPLVPRQEPPAKLSMRHLPSLNTSHSTSRSPSGLTSATVSGPLNAPNFESLQRRQQKPVELANGEIISPQPAAPPMQLHPMAILRRNPEPAQQQQRMPRLQAKSPPQDPMHTVASKTPMEAPQPFHPTSILRRGNQEIVDMMTSPPQMREPAPVAPVTPVAPQPKQYSQVPQFDKRNTAPTAQKQTLLNLFGGMKAPAPVHVQEANALPGTISGVGSPVSPLPSHAILANKRDDSMQSITSNPDYRSRISSIHSDTATIIQQHTRRAASKAPTAGAESGNVTPKTPVDTGFLLGFLENVAKTGGTAANIGKSKR